MPVPLLLLILVQARPTTLSIVAGAILIALGEGLRAWGVVHIGSRSRTRGADVGPLVRSGPFRWSRNPLYMGNILILLGVATMGNEAIPLGITLLLVPLHYSLVVRWEESRLASTHGEAYAAYQETVPRWLGRAASFSAPTPPGEPTDKARESGRDWRSAFRSERSTVLAIATMLLAMYLRIFMG